MLQGDLYVFRAEVCSLQSVLQVELRMQKRALSLTKANRQQQQHPIKHQKSRQANSYRTFPSVCHQKTKVKLSRQPIFPVKSRAGLVTALLCFCSEKQYLHAALLSLNRTPLMEDKARYFYCKIVLSFKLNSSSLFL